MYTTLEDFLKELPMHASAHTAELKGHDMTAVLETKQGRRLCVALKDGVISLPESLAAPDVTATADEQVLLDMLNGRLSPMKAVLTRRVVIRGDVAKLMSLARLV